ncbi:VCBS repeat-containing protein [Fibrella aquatilis]|uniref:VCBS repeat-containing protein n=1 Tax=Fibrella aquatilis TaxID=2817059 RepID=A0A939G3B9_9BACT|nr:VCBS repeat-containing protein [Fibrella aquatilis]MBO0931126.1 VCBS repeat-containing protein [Fibrella aquatilis]
MKLAVTLLLILTCFGCRNGNTLFEKTDPAQTGVAFTNQLTETEQENILSFEYFYNGAGVAAGDLNNDGKVDLYFTGNQVDNKLFINKTETGQPLKFTDATAQAGVAGRKSGWKTGVTLADVNADGWLDIYVCYSGMRPDSLRRNQLFINNGVRASGTTAGVTPTFTERAHEYGLDDSGYSVQANFFDYDRDGDLDCFLINHNLKNYQRKEAAVMRAERDYNAGDKLFRNMSVEQRAKSVGRGAGSIELTDPVSGPPPSAPRSTLFTDVSEAEGIKGNPLGFGLGVSVSDVNGDGWPDVYVTNDFVEDDYLYINQRGRDEITRSDLLPKKAGPAFRDELRERINHTSYSAMGVDIADVNNDGLTDIFTLDMLPEDNARQKLLIWPDNWQVYQAQLKNGFWHQNMRNMLQINEQGAEGGEHRAIAGRFREVGQLAGVSATDWSWGALLADFDLDGRKDLFVSNGLGRDLTNADFTKYISYEEEMRTGTSMLEQLKQMPSTPTKNYIFQNVGGPKPDSVAFQNRQLAWGFDENTRSNGCAYADLDNDGDLDLITNNLNEPSRIYRNTQREQEQGHYLKIRLKGPVGNPFGIGATVTVTQAGETQTQEYYPTRGYLSSSHDALLFGLPDAEKGVRIEVRWPDGRVLTGMKAGPDQVFIADYAQASKEITSLIATIRSSFSPIPLSSLPYTHTIAPVNDFERQQMLPMQYSYTGPRMAVGDVNGDGTPDVFVCGTPEKPGALLVSGEQRVEQRASDETATSPSALRAPPFALRSLPDTAHRKNTAAVIADFNGDKRPDLFVVNGAYNLRDFGTLQDQLWLNQNGQLTPAPLPEDKLNGSCVVAFDADRDGDLDLFVGGHVRPNRFPLTEESRLLINDGKAHFTPQSLGQLGLVTDATTTDLDHDGWPDLIIVGEWMPVTVLHNSKGQLQPNKQTDKQPNSLCGWWNRIEKADLDGDGDEDLIVGNLGQNTQFHATEAEPATMVYDDFDQNGTVDCFMNYFIQGKSYPAYTRDEVGDQVTSLRRTFTTYAAYSTATIDQFFDQSVLQQAHKERISELRTLVLENKNGELVPHALPQSAQEAPVCSILAEDFDHDGKRDLLLLGNNSYFRLRLGKVDANHGLLLRNKGAFQFETVPPAQTGLFITGDVRDAKRVGNMLLIGQCNGPLRTFSVR